MTKLKLSGVSKAYGATLALRRGDLELDTGEVHVLIGANGSGKSTLCKIVAGSVRPDAGEVLLDGRAVTVSGPRAAQALGIGIFYQELSLADHRSVAENICLPDLPRKNGFFVDREALAEKASRYIALFESVAGAELNTAAIVGDLRADQRQLVEIMKALATEASILIFDEPTSALDRAQVDRFFEILRDLKEEGRSIVFISHRMDEIFAIGDRVTVIRDGETVGTEAIADTSPEAVIHMMVGKQETLAAPQAAPPSQEASHEIALTVESLTGVGFRDVNFAVRRGEILGLGGLHGQGQSALLKALFGAPPALAGQIELSGQPLRTENPRAAIAQGIAYVSGDRGRDGVISGRPILENVTPIHALRDGLVLARPTRLSEKALPALKALNTKFAGLSHSIGSLSGGNQQKIVIARWLIDKPDILLLDDPTKGIDLSAKADLFTLIRKLAKEGLAILLYSSEDAELLNNADRILVFNGGAVSRELSGAERTRYNLYHAAYEAA
ncbi:sugar ABC transporter ATP-binding protein [Nitratireductor kimnyeongensis]|uniref:Sugar ABC transporter ATP-binding protein n=1 Tax=Nitratireductor kimnyeongensis TaxID=430679 RepID=A0ABW0T600_9HYPH|nr:sugar ABC transporter ATP-binding protein [Nitratireductor kimnyeongensis]QZZ34422.1 sugar ABC transporter ATP-binding protein [Nitratireductor kimnyeongensis]